MNDLNKYVNLAKYCFDKELDYFDVMKYAKKLCKDETYMEGTLVSRDDFRFIVRVYGMVNKGEIEVNWEGK